MSRLLARLPAVLLAGVLLAGCGALALPVQPAAPVAGSGQVAAVLAAAPQLRSGDLVFRRGRDLVSGMVLAQAPDSRFSHVGVVVVDAAGTGIVHAMPGEDRQPGGVRREPLAAFLDPAVASDAAAYRVPGVDRRALVQRLAGQLGRPFDMAFEMSSSEALYCTELALDALGAAGVVLAPAAQRAPLLREPVVTPDALRQVPGLQLLAG